MVNDQGHSHVCRLVDIRVTVLINQLESLHCGFRVTGHRHLPALPARATPALRDDAGHLGAASWPGPSSHTTHGCPTPGPPRPPCARRRRWCRSTGCTSHRAVEASGYSWGLQTLALNTELKSVQ